MDQQPIIERQSRGSFAIWLIYTAFLFIDPALDPSALLWIATLSVLLIFLALYYTYVSTGNRRTQMTMIVCTGLLGAFTYPWNSGGSTFFIYAAAFLPFWSESLAFILSGFGLELIVLAIETFAKHHTHPHDAWVSMGINTVLVMVIGGSNIFFSQQRRADRRLRLKQDEVEALAAVAERERIARDLHDVLGHTLSLIVLKAELAGRLLERDPERAASEIAEVERTARTALADVREAIGGYRARGLAAEMEAARKALAAAGVTLHADATEMAETRLSAAEETVLSLALREAVTNIVRHAHAHNCTLRFQHIDGSHRLLIQDDGSHDGPPREGDGLRGMRERVEQLGGSLTLRREGGTLLAVDLPAPAETAA